MGPRPPPTDPPAPQAARAPVSQAAPAPQPGALRPASAPAVDLSWPARLRLTREPVTSRALHLPLPGGATRKGGALRLLLVDAGRHVVIEAALDFSADGWPQARPLRAFGRGEPGRRDDVADCAAFRRPSGVCSDGDLAWVADRDNHLLRLIDLHDGRVGTAAGTGQPGARAWCAPVAPRDTPLPGPSDVALAPGAVLLAMPDVHGVWALLPERGQLGPLIGCGRPGHDDGPFARATFGNPQALAVAGHNLLVVDGDRLRLADLARREVLTLCTAADFEDADAARPADWCDVATQGHTAFLLASAPPSLDVLDLRGRRCARWSDVSRALGHPVALEIVGDFLLIAETAPARIWSVRLADRAMRPLPWLAAPTHST